MTTQNSAEVGLSPPDYGIALFENHQKLLAASAISPEVARERGYRSVDTKTNLAGHGFSKVQREVPGLLIPIHGVSPNGPIRHQYRPDSPRLTDTGKTVKYETPTGSHLTLDVPPRVRPSLGDPSVSLWITEGARKADAAATAGLCCVAILGVWGWRGRNADGGRTALADWHDIALHGRRVVICFDSDVVTKPEVRKAMRALAEYLRSKGATVQAVYLPAEGDKVGLDDYLAAGHTVAELEALARDVGDEPEATKQPEKPARPVTPCTLDATLAAYNKWLELPDLVPLLTVLAAYAANFLPGDPVWLLLVGGSGHGKTELLAPLARLRGVSLVSTLSGEAALLSGTAKREQSAEATGGLLREVGDHGVLVLKDFTSILVMNREARAALLGALREVYDGSWVRRVGVDGGKLLAWSGKVGLIGGCTSALDRAHAVVASMGERYVVCRLGDQDPDILGARALSHAGKEATMREELGDAVAGLFANGLPAEPRERTLDERRQLVDLASLVVQARSPVERDYQGEIELVMDAEAPGRVVKALERLWAGLDAIGVDSVTGWKVIARVGLDSIPKLRRAVLGELHDREWVKTSTIAEGVDHPSRTTRRALEDLAAHGVLLRQLGGEGKADRWRIADRAAQRLTAALTVPETSEVGTTAGADTVENIANDVVQDAAKKPLTVHNNKSGTVPLPSAGVCDRCARPASRTVPHWESGEELCPACCQEVEP